MASAGRQALDSRHAEPVHGRGLRSKSTAGRKGGATTERQEGGGMWMGRGQRQRVQTGCEEECAQGALGRFPGTKLTNSKPASPPERRRAAACTVSRPTPAPPDPLRCAVGRSDHAVPDQARRSNRKATSSLPRRHHRVEHRTSMAEARAHDDFGAPRRSGSEEAKRTRRRMGQTDHGRLMSATIGRLARCDSASSSYAK